MSGPAEERLADRHAPAPRPSAKWRALHLRPANLILLGEALVLLAGCSIAIRLVPFRRLAALMGRARAVGTGQEAGADRLVARCRWAVTAWADRVPWRTVCFQRGLALHLMLLRRGIGSRLNYGVKQDDGRGLQAHVWVSVGARTVLGGEEAPSFACLASFPAEDA